MDKLKYGKRKITESYFNGELKSTRVSYCTSVIVEDKAQTLTEIMKAIDQITTGQTSNMVITVKADPKTYKLRMIMKEFSVNES